MVNREKDWSLFYVFWCIIVSKSIKIIFNVLINIKQLLLSFSISFINENQLGDTIENIDDISAY